MNLRAAVGPALLLYGGAVLTKSLLPRAPIPVSAYDMFAVTPPRAAPRAVVCLQSADGSVELWPPFHLFPFEAVRCASVLLAAFDSGDDALVKALLSSAWREQQRGRLSFDQTWPPMRPTIRVIGVCAHEVARSKVDLLAQFNHQVCNRWTPVGDPPHDNVRLHERANS